MSIEFLQSAEWLRFQEAAGKETVPFAGEDFSANGIVHALPLVGKYLYVPRGPVGKISHYQFLISKLIEKAQEKNMKWMRIEPGTEAALEKIKKMTSRKVMKAPHDMQPREIFRIDITKTEEELLQVMKSKTRYNIRLAEKHGVKVFETREKKYSAAFFDLITVTSGRKGITSHPRSYYEKFFQVLPQEMCRLFVAEYEGKVIAANIVIFYGDTVTYLHGGTADEHRDIMAPYLLQWEQIKAAKKEGYQLYDFGGIKTDVSSGRSWQGITKFKTGFSLQTTPTVFPGSYDIILDAKAYAVYDMLRKFRASFVALKKKFSLDVLFRKSFRRE
ncbi:MAG: peptidoglycan bridge formation glycyltransferase FemA/FemB family protein [Candidatus Moranbacteria bacterium]|nr:peptidoglycan bridge formation glycyltransferase FemA/FemB family protein [Candidatus Moranbacteria bacterium]